MGGERSQWVGRFALASPRVKAGVCALAALAGMAVLHFTIRDHDTLFVLSELAHCAGLGLLLYKLVQEKQCRGLSLRAQELTALFLAVRLYCSCAMEWDVHTLLDLLTLGTTLFVVGTMRFGSLRRMYDRECKPYDKAPRIAIALPCAVLAAIAHPETSHWLPHRVLWAFCVYLEAVSVIPQISLLQEQKDPSVERLTGRYLLALGASRFFACAHWVLQFVHSRSQLVHALVGGGAWPILVLVSELVQTLILADFCYLFVRSWATGEQLRLRVEP